MDINGDGMLTQDEIIAAPTSVKGPLKGSPAPKKHETIRKLQQMHNIYAQIY